MSGNPESEPDRNHFGKLAGDYSAKMPRKFQLLMPLKSDIEMLLAKRASYDCIRILLSEANIVVSKNTVYRFCREIIGLKQVRQPDRKKKSPKTVSPAIPFPMKPLINDASTIEATLREQRAQRERLPGLWGRRKRGPRIADSKNL